jgi:hypothetical protein
MMLNKDLHKDALKSFKLIQMIMGDRSRPRNSSANEDLQWLCNCGITQGQMRDEIYVQVCKQLNNNPNKYVSKMCIPVYALNFFFFPFLLTISPSLSITDGAF